MYYLAPRSIAQNLRYLWTTATLKILNLFATTSSFYPQVQLHIELLTPFPKWNPLYPTFLPSYLLSLLCGSLWVPLLSKGTFLGSSRLWPSPLFSPGPVHTLLRGHRHGSEATLPRFKPWFCYFQLGTSNKLVSLSLSFHIWKMNIKVTFTFDHSNENEWDNLHAKHLQMTSSW